MEKPKNFLEDIASEKPESYQEEVFIPAHRGPGRIFAAVAALLIISVIIFIWLQIGKVTVPVMAAWQLSEVQDWVSKHHDNTVLNGVYSKEVAQNGIISQDVEAGKKINKDSTLTVTYSLGADPNEAVAIPDLKSMSLTDIQSWISDNQMSGVTIQYENSDIIAKDSVISLEYVEGSQDQFLRKNRMIIYVSSGPESTDQTVTMPDLYGTTRAALMQWSQENQIPVDIKEEFNNYVDYDKVFEQSIKTDTKITRDDTVSVTISRGKMIKTPDFIGISRTEATDMATLYGVNVFYKLVVSSEEADTVLSQDVATGTEIDGQQLVTLEVAKTDGKSVVPDLVGLTQNEANSLANLYGIKLFVENSDDFNNGIVDTQSVKSGTKIDEGQVITVSLKENKNVIEVPDFTGMTKNEATIAAQDLNLTLLFNDVETTKAENQIVMDQSIKAKTKVGTDETILLNIAANSGIKAEKVFDMNLKQVQAWAAENGVNLNEIDFYNSDFAAGVLYYQDINSGDYIPSSKIFTVYRSLGLVMADNFIGKTKADILNWRDDVNSKGANINLVFSDDKNTPKAKGTITDQSIYGDLVKLNATIQVWVAFSDDGVLMPNFTGYLADNFKLWCAANNIPYSITDSYSDTDEAGTLFGQNYVDAYLPKNEYLRIYNSLGKIYLKDFTNQSRSSMIDWQKDVNNKNGNLTINFTGEFSSTVDEGNIIYQSSADTDIDIGETITVIYSLGR